MYTAIGAVIGALLTAVIGSVTVLKSARDGRAEARTAAVAAQSATSREQEKNRNLQRELDEAKNALAAKALSREHESTTWDRIHAAWTLARSDESEADRARGLAALEALLLEPELTDVVAALLRAATSDVFGDAVDELPEDSDDETAPQGGDDDGQEDQGQP